MTPVVRRLVLFILLLGMIGTIVELVLLEHDEDLKQWIPLVLIAAGVVSLGWLALRPGAGAVSVVRLLAVCFIVSGVLGVVFHFQANIEFQTEADPSISGWPLLQKALRAKAPPALAPGVMIQLGLLSLVYTFRHPANDRGQSPSFDESEKTGTVP